MRILGGLVVVALVGLVAVRTASRKLDGGGVWLRRSLPIGAYVGANGGGKTLAMVHDTLPTLAGIRWECANPTHKHTEAGVTSGVRTVLSTVELRKAATGKLHPLYRPLTGWRQLVVAEHCDVLLDEVTGAASSRSYQALPPQLLQLFLQLRKADVIMRYSTPNWARTDVVLREVTQAVTVCKGFMWEKGDRELLWPAKRLFRWATYDAIEWEALSMEKVAKTKPLLVVWYWRPGRTAMLSYNTRDSVSTLDHVSDSGLCLTCGGKRSQAKCSCETEPRSVIVPSWASAGVEESPATTTPGLLVAVEDQMCHGHTEEIRA